MRPVYFEEIGDYEPTPIYRRERLANLHIGPYVSAKMLVLGLLAAIQSTLLIACVGLRVVYPAMGVLLPGWAELLVTTWLTALAGVALGLGISAAAATPDRAISLVPLALIPQILFAGVIFSLGDGLTLQRVLSWLTISRCVWFAGLPQTTQIASVFVMYSAIASRAGIGSNGLPR